MSDNYTVTASTTGGSDSINLAGDGDWLVTITAGTWGSGDADLQASIDGGTTFVDVTDSAGVINATANKLVRVAGGASYRLDVNVAASTDIVLTAQRAG